MKKLGQTMADDAVSKIMKEADTDKDGKISFKEFSVYFVKKSVESKTEE